MRSPALSQEKKSARAILVGGLMILLVGATFVFRAFRDDRQNEQSSEVNAPAPEAPEEEIPSLTADVVRQKILNKEKIVLLDVRDQEDFNSEHIPHSLLTSPSALQNYGAEPNTVVVIVLSDQDRNRKEAVSNILRQKSYQAFLLRGGIEAWKLSGNQVLSAGDPNSFLDQSKVTYLSVADALKIIQEPSSNLYILDVQSEQDYQKKHLKGAINIPLPLLEKRSSEIPPGRNIIVYGGTELASFQGGVRLSDLNIFTAKTLSGNEHLKPESGLPLEP